jgi:hypothetical protein
MAETTQVLGPVTLLAGTANVTTLEVKGQWVLRVTADGTTGAVSYSPQGMANDQAVVLVRNAAGAVVASATASQMRLAGAVGLRLDVPGVGEIVVGEQPRARGRAGAPQVSGTSAEAAVDLVRIRLLDQDVRIGHMEAAVAVPAAGVTCPGLDVRIVPDATVVAPGDSFGAKVTVRNPNEGDASDIVIRSRMSADPGVDVRPGAVLVNRAQLVPNEDGLRLTTPLRSGQSVEIPVGLRVADTSGPGRIHLGASATGRYGDGPLAVPTGGDLTIEAASVKGPAVTPASQPTDKISVGGKGTATAGNAPTGSGGRKPARTSAGVTGAAGSAASAAPVAPATPTPAPTVTPAPPAAEPTPPPTIEPGSVPASPPTTAEQVASGRLPGEDVSDRRRYGWAAAAAIFLVAIAAAAAARLSAGRR